MIRINRHPTRSQLRLFAALWFPAFWTIVGLLIWRRLDRPEIALGLGGAAVLISLAGLLAPGFMRYVYLGMIGLTYPIGWVISNLLLLVVYYLVLTPIGLILRLLGRDAMRRRFDRSANSYWVERPRAVETARYFRQY